MLHSFSSIKDILLFTDIIIWKLKPTFCKEKKTINLPGSAKKKAIHSQPHDSYFQNFLPSLCTYLPKLISTLSYFSHSYLHNQLQITHASCSVKMRSSLKSKLWNKIPPQGRLANSDIPDAYQQKYTMLQNFANS